MEGIIRRNAMRPGARVVWRSRKRRLGEDAAAGAALDGVETGDAAGVRLKAGHSGVGPTGAGKPVNRACCATRTGGGLLFRVLRKGIRRYRIMLACRRKNGTWHALHGLRREPPTSDGKSPADGGL